MMSLTAARHLAYPGRPDRRTGSLPPELGSASRTREVVAEVGSARAACACTARPGQEGCGLKRGQGTYGEAAMPERAQSRDQHVLAGLEVQPATGRGERPAGVVELAEHLLITFPDKSGLLGAEAQLVLHAGEPNSGFIPVSGAGTARGAAGGHRRHGLGAGPVAGIGQRGRAFAELRSWPAGNRVACALTAGGA
jgi:hypothetical protein